MAREEGGGVLVPAQGGAKRHAPSRRSGFVSAWYGESLLGSLEAAKRTGAAGLEGFESMAEAPAEVPSGRVPEGLSCEGADAGAGATRHAL